MSYETIRTCVDAISPVALRERRRALTIAAIDGMGGPSAPRAIAPISSIWSNGTTLHVSFMGGTAQERQTVEKTAKQWEEFANLKLVFDNSPQAQIRVAFVQDGRSWSYMGTDNLDIPALAPTMNFGWPLEEGTILHEFGHAIGLAHEHQSPLGGLLWNEPVVLARTRRSAEQLGRGDDPFQRPRQVSGESDSAAPHFDPTVDHALCLPGALDDQWRLDQREQRRLRNGPVLRRQQEHVSLPGRGGTGAVVLTVAENAGVEGEIGKTGEQDLYKFNAKTAGTYTIETEGPTDVVMRLFGPNTQTNLIAEDDDSGSDRNARIVRQLSSGDYFVQVRHFSPNEKGKYRIRVSR